MDVIRSVKSRVPRGKKGRKAAVDVYGDYGNTGPKVDSPAPAVKEPAPAQTSRPVDEDDVVEVTGQDGASTPVCPSASMKNPMPAPTGSEYQCTGSVKTPPINERGRVGQGRGSPLMDGGTPTRATAVPNPAVTPDAIKDDAVGGPGGSSGAAAPDVGVISQLLLQVLGGARCSGEAAFPGLNTMGQGGAAAELINVLQRLQSATLPGEASMGRERTPPATTIAGNTNPAATPKSARASNVRDAGAPIAVAEEGRSPRRGVAGAATAKGDSSGEQTGAGVGELTKELNCGLWKNPLEHDKLEEVNARDYGNHSSRGTKRERANDYVSVVVDFDPDCKNRQRTPGLPTPEQIGFYGKMAMDYLLRKCRARGVTYWPNNTMRYYALKVALRRDYDVCYQDVAKLMEDKNYSSKINKLWANWRTDTSTASRRSLIDALKIKVEADGIFKIEVPVSVKETLVKTYAPKQNVGQSLPNWSHEEGDRRPFTSKEFFEACVEAYPEWLTEDFMVLVPYHIAWVMYSVSLSPHVG
ncbi:unnamed protein product [Closterium sp. Naga37s-1]|nr:unnamed protein product [Closterium sp. Naga37s-1]